MFVGVAVSDASFHTEEHATNPNPHNHDANPLFGTTFRTNLKIPTRHSLPLSTLPSEKTSKLSKISQTQSSVESETTFVEGLSEVDTITSRLD